MIDEIAAALPSSSAQGIARAVTLLAAQGAIVPGDRLPTIRELARGLGVSSSTVGEAWRTLAARGVVDTQGRRGTFLREASAGEPVRQFRHVFGVDAETDLSTGYPDPELLLDLRPFLKTVAEGRRFDGYPEAAMEPELAELLGSVLPFAPPALALGTDSLSTFGELLPLLTRYGDRVVVGTADFAPYLDLYNRFGLDLVPVPQDEEGLRLDDVAHAISAGVALVVLQPRVHNPTGVTMSPTRLERIAALCRSSDTPILELDHFGGLGSSPLMSAATTAPLQTIHLRTFSKDLHPDLRVCAVAGAADVLDRLHQRRIGGSWVSAVNQRLLAAVLRSPEVPPAIRSHKRVYDVRRRALLDSLDACGISVSSRDGFNIWVPVRSEEAALVYLASRGISAAPGSPFQAAPDQVPHIRVSIAQMREGHEHIAETIASAARTRRLGAYEPSR